MKYRFLLLSAGVFLISIATIKSRADVISDLFNEPDRKNGEVIVERPFDVNASYKERRQTNGVLFSINYEKFYPLDYISEYNDVFVESILDGTPINLIGAEIGYKYNMQLGSLGLLLGYAQGGGNSTSDRSLAVSRTTVSANIAFDNYFDEPWVVPYAQAGISRFGLKETKPNSDGVSSSASNVPSYRLGLLFQLNWIENSIDPSSSGEARRSSGLENTFLDIYYISHLETSNSTATIDPNSTGEPNMRSNQFGAALKMEF
jgi:hypothetical protein